MGDCVIKLIPSFAVEKNRKLCQSNLKVSYKDFIPSIKVHFYIAFFRNTYFNLEVVQDYLPKVVSQKSASLTKMLSKNKMVAYQKDCRTNMVTFSKRKCENKTND